MVNSVVMASRRTSDSPSFRGSTTALNPESSSTMSRFRVREQGSRPGMTLSLLRLAGVLDRLEGLELDVVEFAVDLLDLADVDILHDVAGLRIDRDRAPRALPLHPLHGFNQRVAVGLAAGLFQRLVDQVNAVIAAHRHEARARTE